VEGVSAHNSTKHNILVKKSKKRRKNELLFKTDVKKKTEGVWHLLNITMTSSLFCNGKKKRHDVNTKTIGNVNVKESHAVG